MASAFISQLTKLKRDNNIDDGKDGSVDSNDVEAAEHFVTEVDRGSKRLGTVSSIGLICNRMLGTGIFVTSATIFRLVGSVGLSLILWVIGALVALLGLYVYLEFGTAIPRNGGEKNYLEYVFKKPRFFMTSMYAAYVFFLGWAAGNSVIAATMFLTAFGVKETKWNTRLAGVAVTFFCFLLNSITVKGGLYFQNILGAFKIIIVLFISVVGWVALAGGVKGAAGRSNFHNSFHSETSVSAYGVVTALYSVIWSFVGYSNANYALGEVRNPVKTLKRAGPGSLLLLSVLYLFVNIAYFAVVPKEYMRKHDAIVALEFFAITFGEKARRVASVFIGLSALGNVSSVIFSQGRIIQQLGREGVLPFSNLFATSKPLHSPMVALFQHFVVCAVTILAPSPGDAYNMILNLISYPMNIVNAAISGGLLWIHWQKLQGKLEWNPPIKAGPFITSAFFIANIYLIIVPYVPPAAGENVYTSLPYYIHCVITWGILAIGGLYWYVWFKLLPRLYNYEVVYVEVLGEDGFWRNKIVRRSKDAAIECTATDHSSAQRLDKTYLEGANCSFETLNAQKR